MLKKVLSAITAVAITVTMSVGVFAGSSSKYVTGYGLLQGFLNSNADAGTGVEYNNDNAKLSMGILFQDVNGNDIGSQVYEYSERGATTLIVIWTGIPYNASCAYGVHGVQGGYTYGSDAVYTFTTL